MHLIIDGYNLIHHTPEFLMAADLDQGRQALMLALRLYRKKKPHRITVVFDGGPEAEPQRASLEGVPVVFAGNRLSADQVIVQLARAQGGGVTVISDDRALGEQCRAWGAEVIGARVFAARLLATAQGAGLAQDDDQEGWDFSTKKKGPARREPKAKRRQSSRLQKL